MSGKVQTPLKRPRSDESTNVERPRTDKTQAPKTYSPLGLFIGAISLVVFHLFLLSELEQAVILIHDHLSLLAPYALRFPLALFLAFSPGTQSARTFLHEMKHAAMVVLTGNKLIRFDFFSRAEAERRKIRACVHFRVRENRWGRFTLAFIATAPFAFPILTILSLPISYLILQTDPYVALMLVGFAFGLDEGCAAKDLLNVNHFKGGGDFAKCNGGPALCLPYLLAANLVFFDMFLFWSEWAVSLPA